jgi:hypothetical protein
MRTMLRVRLALLVAQALSTGAFAQTAGTRPADSDTYQWSGELVSFDGTAGTAIVKARIVDQDAAAEVKKFRTGDRVLLQWSGYEIYADAIRRVMPYTESRSANDRFLLPVELVSNETPNQYLTFRLRVPVGSAPALKEVKPGEWITVTSAHKAARETDAVVSARPYVTASTPATN